MLIWSHHEAVSVVLDHTAVHFHDLHEARSLVDLAELLFELVEDRLAIGDVVLQFKTQLIILESFELIPTGLVTASRSLASLLKVVERILSPRLIRRNRLARATWTSHRPNRLVA